MKNELQWKEKEKNHEEDFEKVEVVLEVDSDVLLEVDQVEEDDDIEEIEMREEHLENEVSEVDHLLLDFQMIQDLLDQEKIDEKEKNLIHQEEVL